MIDLHFSWCDCIYFTSCADTWSSGRMAELNSIIQQLHWLSLYCPYYQNPNQRSSMAYEWPQVTDWMLGRSSQVPESLQLSCIFFTCYSIFCTHFIHIHCLLELYYITKSFLRYPSVLSGIFPFSWQLLSCGHQVFVETIFWQLNRHLSKWR